MNKKTIKQEGFILLGFIVFGTILILPYLHSINENLFNSIPPYTPQQQLFMNLRLIGFILIFAGYPASWLFRYSIGTFKLFTSKTADFKQAMILWIMGVLICGIFLCAPTVTDYCGIRCQNDHLDWMWILPKCLTVLIIGGLLVYSLREKK